MNHTREGASRAFTLVELIVSMALLTVLSLLLLSMSDQTSRVWRSTTGKLEPFREARAAFESMTTRLAQATLNTYWDYDNPNAPTRYQRRSELRFLSGPAVQILAGGPDDPVRLTHAVFFAAPLGYTEDARYRGFENLLCTWGYFLEYGNDAELRPPFLTERMVPLRYRSRLKELWQPAEQNSIYAFTSPRDAGAALRARTYAGRDWFQTALRSARPPTRVVAENVIALVITPRLSRADEAEVRGAGSGTSRDYSPLAPQYLYDSSPASGAVDERYRDGRLNPVHQLPPVLEVTVVAIDEMSAARLDLSAGTPDVFNLAQKFARSGDLSRDLLLAHGGEASLEHDLISRRAAYRVFTTNVAVRAAKWSREQSQ